MSGYVWNGETWEPKASYYARKPVPHARFPMIMTDSHYDYDSMLTGERITGRAQHREHLKAHGVEVREDAPAWVREREKMRAEGLSQDEIAAEEAKSKQPAPDDPVISFEWQDVEP